MKEIENESSLFRLKRVIMSLLTPSFFSVVVATFSIWFYLFRVGRQDIFLEVYFTKELFTSVTIFLILSVLLVLILFFSPSFLLSVFISRGENETKDMEVMKQKYINLLLMTTLVTVVAFYIFSLVFFEHKPITAYSLLLLAGGIILLSIVLNALTSWRTVESLGRYKWGMDYCKHFSVMYIFKPILISINAWAFVFPMPFILKSLSFDPGASTFEQSITIILLTLAIAVLSLIPGVVFLRLQSGSSVFDKVFKTVGVAFVLLVMISFVVTTLPVYIVNYAMMMSGVSDMRVFRYSVPVEKYPSIIFGNKIWNSSVAMNNRYNTFDGVMIFSLGGVSLVCPPVVATSYKASLRYSLSNNNKDTYLAELRDNAMYCQKIPAVDLHKWKS